MPDPVILWFRRDLRLADHPALTAAIARGGPVIPVFILDEVAADLAPRRNSGWGWGLRRSREACRRGAAADPAAGARAAALRGADRRNGRQGRLLDPHL